MSTFYDQAFKRIKGNRQFTYPLNPSGAKNCLGPQSKHPRVNNMSRRLHISKTIYYYPWVFLKNNLFFFLCKLWTPPLWYHPTPEDHDLKKHESTLPWGCFQTSYSISGQFSLVKKISKDFILYIPIYM